MQKHHYFASTGFGWGTADTRAQAIAKAASIAGRTTINGAVKHSDGLYVWTCRVLAPATATYYIEYYRPKGIDIEAPQDFKIMNVKGHVMPLDRYDEDAE